MKENTVAAIAAAAVVVYHGWRWLTGEPKSPDPWGKEVEDQLSSGDAQPVCLRCFEASEPNDAFCPHCSAPLDPYHSTDPSRAIFCYDAPFESAHSHQTGLLLTGYSLLAPYYLSVFALPFWAMILFRIGRNSPEKTEKPPEIPEPQAS